MKQTKLLMSILTLGSLITTSPLMADKVHKHNIQLQLSDSNGFAIPGTEFWVTVDIIKDDSLVTVQLPTINFQIESDISPNNPVGPGPISGGYLYTINGFLPEEFRPIDMVPRSIVAASNDGMSPVFSFTQDPSTLPQPPVGYIVQITNAGELQIEAAGTFGNIIPVGPQILMPCSITYSVKSFKKLNENTKISKGATNVTQFANPRALNDGFRDLHINDAFKGKVAFAWTDNSQFKHQDNGVMDTMVAVGKVKEGKLKIKKIVNLTNFPDIPFSPTHQGIQSWDTSVAINRANPKNIIVSWAEINRANPSVPNALPFRAASFDGGKTWPINGPMNVPPTGNPASIGDCRGVSSDKFGNIWYSATNRFDSSGNSINQAYFAVSTDGGVTFTLAYTAPAMDPSIGFTDFPQYGFGGDGFGNYGLWFQNTTYLNNGDAYPNIGFIQIPGPLTPGAFPLTATYTPLPGLDNAITETDITASIDGKIWLNGVPNSTPAFTFINSSLVAFKSPGDADKNWAGPWDTLVSDNINLGTFYTSAPNQISEPDQGYFITGRQIIFDEKRQALYNFTGGNFPDNSQNMYLYFIISRDNSMTWSDPIRVNTSHTGNRGFQSMALDEKTGDLVFGWYDGRHDKSYQSVKYYGAVLTARELDKMVNELPLSNPNFVVPSVGA